MTPEMPRPTMREVFDEHAAYVWRALRHLGVPESEADDLCQEVFVVVHRRLASFEGRSSLRTWLYGICLRVASDYRRRARVRYERPAADPARDLAEPVGFAPDERAQARAELLALLDGLDEDKREVLVLYEIEGVAMMEVAEIVGCPLQTAYSRLHAARAKLVDLAKEREAKGKGP
jgi:RNA polymerase sigma-70 factor (ECF subfamily)